MGTLLGGTYLELLILAFCAAILSDTGKSSGPVFDVVGPDFLPSVVAGTVGVLTLMQLAWFILRWRNGEEETQAVLPAADVWAGRVLAGLFCVLTAIYVVVLSREWSPFWLATAVYLTLATILLSRRLNWRDLLLGSAIGLVMGIGLQLVFTGLLIIDLPV